MLSVQSDAPVHASFPSVHAFIMLEGTMNLTGETQPLVEQLMMIKRMQVNDCSVRFYSKHNHLPRQPTVKAFHLHFINICSEWGFFSPLQQIPASLFVLEIWKACFTGLIESPEGTEELKWTAFTFLKVTYFVSLLDKRPSYYCTS